MADNQLDIKLIVLPPIYLRWWFLVLAVLLVASGIRYWQYWRESSHRREQERLEKEVQRQTATIRSQAEELKRLDEAKSRFFANVSHELRTPLTLILGPIGSLLKSPHLHPKDQEQARVAQQHGWQLLGLVNEILDLSKLESGKMVLQEQPVLFPDFMRRVVSSFESHAEHLQIRFIYEYRAPARLRLLLDEDKVQKVLNNLLSNALKFTPPNAGRAVTVRVEEIDHQIRICVQDTGRGIHPDDLPQVFERFFQTGQPNAPIEGGTGIGLSLCREFMYLMDGKIWVESALGQGSQFYVEFPVKEVLGAGASDPADLFEPESISMLSPQKQSTAVDRGALPRILLVEDNISMRNYIQSVLNDYFEVTGVEHGGAALEAIDSIRPHLVISDIMMPVMDGFQLLDRLKSDERWRHLPVIMLTARADIRDKLRALRTGVDDYLLKPFEEDELRARVENLLQNYHNRQYTDIAEEEQPIPDEAEKSVPGTSAEDLEWLGKLEKLVRDMVGDSRLNADFLAAQMFVGRSIFFKRVKILTGLTPNEYVQTVRMAVARELLETRIAKSVKEAAYTVGLRDVKYFSEQFNKYYGKLPSTYL